MLKHLEQLLKSPRELALVYACEYADSFSSFALDYVFVLYLSMCFGMSDVAASWIYGIFGIMSLLFGILFGPLIDNIGVKWSLVLGTLTSTFARLALVFVTDTVTLFATLLVLLPMGVALTSNVLKLGIRRYLVINSAALSAAIMLTVTRTIIPDFGLPYRPYLLLACIPGFVQFFITLFLRETAIDEATQSLTEYKPQPCPPRDFTVRSLYVCSCKADSTNTNVQSPKAQGFKANFSSVTGAVVGVACFTFGEMIWAPRLLELSVMVRTRFIDFPYLRNNVELAGGARGTRRDRGYMLHLYRKDSRSLSGRDAGHCNRGGMVWVYVGGIASR
ncbi:major facilitator family protein [Cyclospora cayetanensis]|uniref:Major facilitator family protein n=1 Tax=Cyclospora cayetanensis TaxID=88456 RepID=A0A1D3D5R1_9EIME|nr:major facilitator family protein [Cyclospora cayetanensis]